MKAVIDLSTFQGANVDFRVMARNGVDGIITRAGNGLKADLTCAGNIARAKAVGLKTGVYWFANPRVSSGAQQGGSLAAAHKAYGCEIPPMLDCESYLNESHGGFPDIFGPTLSAWYWDMLIAAQGITGRPPIVYANASYWDNNVANEARWSQYDLMCARYPFYSVASCAAHPVPLNAQQWWDWISRATSSRPQPPKCWNHWDGWQFSAGYNQRGAAYGCISENLDLNVVQDEAWSRWTGITPNSPPVQAPPVQQSPQQSTIEEEDEEDMGKPFMIRANGRNEMFVSANGAVFIQPADSTVAVTWGQFMAFQGTLAGLANGQYPPQFECGADTAFYDSFLKQMNDQQLVVQMPEWPAFPPFPAPTPATSGPVHLKGIVDIQTAS